MVETGEKPAEFVEALAKGIGILEAFDAANPEMTLSEVARRVGLSPAAARRSLLTLETLGYIGRREKRFHLRPKLMALGSAFYFSARIDEVLQEDLRGIVDRFGDASSVGTLDGEDVIYVAHVTVQRARRAAAVAGARYPAYATSMGRVLLAGLPDEKIDAYLRAYTPRKLTSRTCTNPQALRAAIMVARRDGHATTVDQLDYGITALAVPIRGPDGATIAALNTSGYTGMITPEQLVEERLPALQEAASHIAHQLTRYPTLRAVLGG
ncbi:IclR family transcriptional regulator domain-containing protein [Sagittula salina]|uniref:Helix-turn-helix domain-containing protein n=1 Tax=Sagittula salina TaxID=2820268 RepID=A0A940MPJ9_9RHOB|nr:IclR family transcriptional regulator C-terminal domain-containing protein [Sagittula salina]MBP0481797.1 helix-turn-helix domain-containing protein [Sagittula salina]